MFGNGSKNCYRFCPKYSSSECNTRTRIFNITSFRAEHCHGNKSIQIITTTHNTQDFISVLPNLSHVFAESQGSELPTLKNGDTDLKETEWDGVDWKHLAQDRAVVNGAENFLPM